jgi:cellulose synthase/poly-beta-1,6-N-acetylglucosamine synthase-like glycosyltransferase
MEGALYAYSARSVISIIVPAYNEAGRIGAQLDALAAQADQRDCEVVVADNGSTDDTVAVASSWSGHMPLRVVDASARRGQAAARNVAVGESRGDLLVFVDADDVVMPGFVDAWRALAVDVAFASGPVVFFSHDEPPPSDSSRAPRALPVHLGFLPYALGANFGVRRSWFERAGGFDETAPPSEDVELSWRLQLLGATLDFVPGAVVAKREAPTFGATARQYFRYGRRDPFLYRQFRAAGVPAPDLRATLTSYAGLFARLPLLWRAESRRRWVHQAARRAGRAVGSLQARAWYP